MTTTFNVGDPAHTSINGDRSPCKVIKASKTGHKLTVEMWQPCDFRDNPQHGGYTEADRDCSFKRPENPAQRIFLRGKDGRYRQQGCRYITLGPGMAFARNPHI